VTKVPDWRALTFLVVSCLHGLANAQSAAPSPNCPTTTAALYTRIRSLGLDERRVYQVRGAFIDRPNLHLTLDDGTLAFTEDICGRITGAFFEGEGEVLLRPPNQVERGSLALFTGMAILEEQFNTAYFRFNDETAADWQSALSPLLGADAGEFIKRWNDTSRALSESDALRFLLDFSHFLPSPTASQPLPAFPRLFHASLQGQKLGSFDLFLDAGAAEPLWAGQLRLRDGVPFWDVWTSFKPGPAEPKSQSAKAVGELNIGSFRIRASVQPPTILRATAEVEVAIRKGGRRTLLFELSRYLKLDSVQMDGHPLDFIQNAALEGTQLQRKGNDLVAVVFPAPLESGKKLKLTFRYAGEVLSEAGNGLLYVGERGTWYPNLGFSPASLIWNFNTRPAGRWWQPENSQPRRPTFRACKPRAGYPKGPLW